MDSIVRFELFLQLNDLLVAFIESGSECCHDVAVLMKYMFIPIDLLFVFFYLAPLTFNFRNFVLVLLTD